MFSKLQTLKKRRLWNYFQDLFILFFKNALAQHEQVGKYGSTMGAFADNPSTFTVFMCEALCKEPFCCLSTMASFCPFQIWMQHCTLNHVKSGSNWSNYKCFQGIFSGCYFYNLVQWANATALANACLWRFVSGQVLRLVLLLLWSDKNTNWVWILIMFAWFGVIIAYRSFHTS